MLRFVDSFDHYATVDIAEKWTSKTSSPTISAANGRRGTASLRIPVWGEWVTLTLDNQPAWMAGFALRFSTLPTASTGLAAWYDGATIQCDLRLTPTGTLAVTRAGTVLGTSTLALTTGLCYYLEFFAVIHTTPVQITIRVDGVTLLTLTNVNTQNTANARANTLYLGNLAGGATGSMGNQDFDDLYVCDTTGSRNNALLGDCRVDCLMPTGDGSNSAWTPSTGTTHATLVDDAAPNDNTDYLASATSGARDTHALGNLPAMSGPAIQGVQHVISAAKDDAGTRQLQSCLKSGGTTQSGATHTLTTSYAFYKQIWETDPNTSTTWTAAAIDALEAGVENV